MGDVIRGKWRNISRKLRSKLAGSKMESYARGDWEDLSDRLQKSYGYSKEQAEEEIRKFQRSIT